MKRKLVALGVGLLVCAATIACASGGAGMGGGSSSSEGATWDWCMTCGGSGSVHYVTTGETEVCPTCHGSGGTWR